tara:strand:- start:59 stop:295 length:237 start_codon:yes stop_codon:yes gene_type:complete
MDWFYFYFMFYFIFMAVLNKQKWPWPAGAAFCVGILALPKNIRAASSGTCVLIKGVFVPSFARGPLKNKNNSLLENTF